MNTDKLDKILKDHKLWLMDNTTGRRADLRGVDLRRADLRGVDLRGADLRGVDLRGVDLRGADLRGANLEGANLRGANLEGANLEGANLDFSSGVPFSCRGTDIKGDSRLFSQMVFHLTRQDWSSCTEKERKWLNSIPSKIKNGFCKYRNDVEKI